MKAPGLPPTMPWAFSLPRILPPGLGMCPTPESLPQALSPTERSCRALLEKNHWEYKEEKGSWKTLQLPRMQRVLLPALGAGGVRLLICFDACQLRELRGHN